MLFRKGSSKGSNISVFPSKVGGEAVSAFGMGNAALSFLSGVKSAVAAVGRSFDAGWLWDLIFGLLGWLVESFKTSVTMCHLTIGSSF